MKAWFSWRDWAIGIGVVFGTKRFQFKLDVGPLHLRVWP